MKLTEHKHCLLIEDFFSSSFLAGFTNNSLAGNPPQDINTALSFLGRQIKTAYLNQIHSEKVLVVDQAGCYQGDGLFTPLEKASNGERGSLTGFTKSSGLALVVKTADCLPLIFESKELGVIGVVHMGWRSAKSEILDNIPYDLNSFKVAAGVGLRRPCYQVGDDFLAYQLFKPFIKKDGSELYFNPIEFAKNRLIGGGLKEDNFIDLDICSLCSENNYFSCRRDNTSSRTLSFVLKI